MYRMRDVGTCEQFVGKCLVMFDRIVSCNSYLASCFSLYCTAVPHTTAVVHTQRAPPRVEPPHPFLLPRVNSHRHRSALHRAVCPQLTYSRLEQHADASCTPQAPWEFDGPRIAASSIDEHAPVAKRRPDTQHQHANVTISKAFAERREHPPF